jgi:hypothetical protein
VAKGRRAHRARVVVSAEDQSGKGGQATGNESPDMSERARRGAGGFVHRGGGRSPGQDVASREWKEQIGVGRALRVEDTCLVEVAYLLGGVDNHSLRFKIYSHFRNQGHLPNPIIVYFSAPSVLDILEETRLSINVLGKMEGRGSCLVIRRHCLFCQTIRPGCSRVQK